MPYIDVKLAGKINIEQRREIAKGISDVIYEVAGKPRDSIYITFTEFDRTNWAKGYNILSDMDAKEGKS
ncbi:4-oxalocrotonate tautomerase [Helicobacter sp. 13S00401-1]|uniref:tautomerase family protein n=1 Tax=Helicobacter sp. 13S00401-1 TaxID=1905758 RepID=UPI000BA50D66|nr:tautomerase family protein [Helicobacter sp. 13S00401-1]PAF51068.1 4-oxalocrotonate tautomerase [Helicobacter sp. 13S00401-1]